MKRINTLKLNYEFKNVFNRGKYYIGNQVIIYILKNKNYIGVFEYQGKKEKNDIVIEIEPIVSRYMWNKVNLKK